MKSDPYQTLAERLDALPNGFPPTESGVEQRLLAKIFSPEEATLASQLRLTLETPEQIAVRLSEDSKILKRRLKSMTRRGLIRAGKTDSGLGYGLLPFVVGIYEMQLERMDVELALLFEEYFQQTFNQFLQVKPSVHRVIPVNESVRMDMEVQPFENAVDIISSAQAWGVMDCICRRQKSLIGDPCDHPVEVCMVFHKRPGAFAGNQVVRELNKEQAMDTLRQAADAGLVHSVSNKKEDLSYICNCCTCSCGILRGMAEMGIANVVARSAFVNQADEDLCTACETCLDYCQFDALILEDFTVSVNSIRCVGCGVCVSNCPEDALALIRRPQEEILPVPKTKMEWLTDRAAERGLNLQDLM
ncbi:MAG: 4Fe-4S binding protein [Anaerolineales bacterium]|jgi:Pyruvate/2-oxoacid:ferredoxin oxidoreductase delta subunit